MKFSNVLNQSQNSVLLYKKRKDEFYAAAVWPSLTFHCTTIIGLLPFADMIICRDCNNSQESLVVNYDTDMRCQ